MSIRIACLIAVLLCINRSGAAQATNRISIEETRLNGAPAFVLLGVTPSAVEQPTSPRAFATTVFSSVGGSEASSTLPRNLAFEFSPYWWFSGSRLTWEEYQTDDTIIKNAQRTLTFSLATSEVDVEDPDEDTATGLGFGFRVNLLKGQPSEAARLAKTNLQSVLRGELEDLPDDPAAFTGFGEEFKKRTREAVAAYRQAILSRVGWQLEVAGGTSGVFTENDFGGGRFRSSGLWITPAYRAAKGPLTDFTLVGVGRYLHHNRETDDVSTFDAGARAVWTVPDKPYVFSAEYVQRFSDQEDPGDSHRYSASLEYHFQNGLVAMVSLGRDFESIVTGERDSFALFGFNLSLGQVARTLER